VHYSSLVVLSAEQADSDRDRRSGLCDRPCDGPENGHLVIRLKSLSRMREGRVMTSSVTLPAALAPADLDVESLLLEGMLPIITPPP
jgi:hypothetical protein